MGTGDLQHGSRDASNEVVEPPARRDPHELRKEWRAAQVRARGSSDRGSAREPGRWTVPAGVASGVLLVAFGFVVYATARTHPWLRSGVGVPLAAGVYLAFAGAAYSSSYGYRRGDRRAALKLTAMIVTGATLLVAVVVVVVLLLLSDSDSSDGSQNQSRDNGNRPSTFDDSLDEGVGANLLLNSVSSKGSAAWAAGWYADPWGKARVRYWDGSNWTGHTA